MSLPVRMADSERRISALEDMVGIGSAHAAAIAPWPGQSSRSWAEATVLLGLPLVLLLGAHYLLIIVLSSTSPLFLLVAAVALPLPFGFLVSARALPRLSRWFGLAFVMALAATLGMSAVTAVVDDVPLLPQGRRDWIELAQFTCSIALSFSTGIILGWVFWRRMARREELGNLAGLPYRLARQLLGPRYPPHQAHRATTALLGVLRLLMAGLTIAGSVYSGWQRFFG